MSNSSPFPTFSDIFEQWCTAAGLKASNFVVYLGKHSGKTERAYYHYAQAMVWESDLSQVGPEAAAKRISNAIRQNISQTNLRRRFESYKQARGIIASFIRKSRSQKEWVAPASTQRRVDKAKKAILVWEADMSKFIDIGTTNGMAPTVGSRPRHTG